MNWRSELEAIIDAVPPDQVPDAIGELEAAQARLLTRLLVPANGSEAYLTATEVSEMLKVDRRWPYRHADELGAVHLSDRCVRFPRSKVERYLARR